jgi:hypothetical protein
MPEATKFCPHCGQPAGQVPVAPVQPYPPQPFPPAPAKKKTGWIIALIAGVVLLAVLVIAVILGGGSCSVTTARLTEAAMASEVDPDTMEPITKTDEFQSDTSVIYATALLKNAPEDTKITATWIYLEDDTEIASVDALSTETNQAVSFSLSRPDNGFPVGQYKVELAIDGKLSETLRFTVEASAVVLKPQLTEAAMASKINPDTQKAETRTDRFQADTAVIYATALLVDAPKNTKITATWTYTDDKTEIASVDVLSTETSQYVSFSLSRPDNGFPAGTYQVELAIDGKQAETLRFTVEEPAVVLIPELTEATMASEIDPNTQKAVTKTDRFQTDTAVIYATALLIDAPKDTKITATWVYADDKTEIASVDVLSTQTSQYVSFSLSRPDNGFPAGEYQVELVIDGKTAETLWFTVEEPVVVLTPQLTDAAMASEINPDTLIPVTTADRFLTDTPVIYATALLTDAPENTRITATWIYVTEDYNIGTVDLFSTEASQAIMFYLNQPEEGFPAGQYKVELAIDGKQVETLVFTVEP